MSDTIVHSSGKPKDTMDYYGAQPGHNRNIKTIHVPTSLGAPRGDIDSTVGGGQYAMRGKLEQALATSGSPVEHDVVDVQQVLKSANLERTSQGSVPNAPQILALAKHTSARVKDAVDKGYLPIIAGGDHVSLLMGITEMLDRYPDPENPGYSLLKFVFTDAHPDANKDDGNAHGRTVSTLLGDGPEALKPLMNGHLKLHPDRVMFVGISKPDEAEKVRLRGLPKDHVWDLIKMRKDPNKFHEAVQKFLTTEKDGNVERAEFWAEMDPDVLQKMDSEGTPMPSSIGMSKVELDMLALYLAAEGKLVGAGFAEIAPELDVGGHTKACVHDYLYRVLGKGDEYYHEYNPTKATKRGKPRSKLRKAVYALAAAASIAVATVGGYFASKIGTKQTASKPVPTLKAEERDEKKAFTGISKYNKFNAFYPSYQEEQLWSANTGKMLKTGFKNIAEVLAAENSELRKKIKIYQDYKKEHGMDNTAYFYKDNILSVIYGAEIKAEGNQEVKNAIWGVASVILGDEYDDFVKSYDHFIRLVDRGEVEDWMRLSGYRL